ncbi:MAG: hypothetical protein NTY50_14690 [Methylobacter sp.]|nr:hypothetical protein [Methylobacter sp.]
MKINNFILLLLALTIAIASFVIYLYLSCHIPDKLLMPIVGFLAIIITLIGLYISSTQWQKSRLENEVLKEQFKLITSLLEHIQKNPNAGFTVISRDGKVLMGSLICFSARNYKSLEDIAKEDRYIVKHFPPDYEHPHFFNELNNEIIHNPFFPKELFQILNKLDTASYFVASDYSKNWFNDDSIALEKQFVLEKGSKKESLDKKPLRVPYGSSHLKLSDAIIVYKEFNNALNLWLKNNHIDININI